MLATRITLNLGASPTGNARLHSTTANATPPADYPNGTDANRLLSQTPGAIMQLRAVEPSKPVQN
eukprot:11178217-Lingulodinium_polyedra.AAC.1